MIYFRNPALGQSLRRIILARLHLPPLSDTPGLRRGKCRTHRNVSSGGYIARAKNDRMLMMCAAQALATALVVHSRRPQYVRVEGAKL
jgi:hypothetical protein